MPDSADRTPPFSTADRSLADRVDAVERALTADSDGDPAPRATGVDPARVEALEADLADLRAAVDALRGVVTDLDREEMPDGADYANGSAVAPHRASWPESDTHDAPDGRPADRPEDLFAPTGRAIPTPDALSDPEAAPGDDPAEEAPRDDPAGKSPTGFLARVSETL